MRDVERLERDIEYFLAEADECAFTAAQLRSIAAAIPGTGVDAAQAAEWSRVLLVGRRCAAERAANLRDIARMIEARREALIAEHNA